MSTLSTTLPNQPATPLLVRGEPFIWISNLLANRVAYHILFWTLVFLLNAAYITYIEHDWHITLYNFALRTPFILACCYINLYWLLPRYYSSGKIFTYAGWVTITILSLNAFNLFVLDACVDTPICPKTYEAMASFTWNNYVYKAFYLVSIVGLTSGIKLSKDFLVEKQKADAIEKEKLQTELSLLKSQIHPHFFFNTLNNLYALTMKKSDLAPEMLLKLSELMSYSLYEAEGLYISLEKEIKHISNYIELESLRFGNKMTVVFDVNGVPNDKRVPPLIFLPFIENCFKHATVKGLEKTITITLNVEDSIVTLHTRNPYSKTNKASVQKGGLGLKNAQRRLQLLYETTYQLESTEGGDFFEVKLQIPLP
jgi:two-component system, LytTR family, sensor kinase